MSMFLCDYCPFNMELFDVTDDLIMLHLHLVSLFSQIEISFMFHTFKIQIWDLTTCFFAPFSNDDSHFQHCNFTVHGI